MADVLTKEDVLRAETERKRYRDARAAFEKRIIDEEKAWRLKMYDGYGNGEKNKVAPSNSAYMWNAVVSKHADMMDNYPSAVFLPRESSDEREAKTLSSIVPVILERNGFEGVYSDSEWYRIKHGTSCIGVFWDTDALSGRGDIAVKSIDLLNVFYKSGITDISKSPNLFICASEDYDALRERYPDAVLPSCASEKVADYEREDSVDRSKELLVVDWYYKKRVGKRTIVHLCKYVGDEILYASENDPDLRYRGFYDHGEYPVVFNTLYPEEGSCTGYGLIAVSLSAQRYIDELDALMMSYAKNALKPRWFAKKSAGVNRLQYLDSSEAIVDVEGDIDEEKLKQITLAPISPVYYSLLERKIGELKETSGNRDVNSGGVTGGVTSGAAIATLQEAGNKTSRDAVKADYRAFEKVVRLIIELMRQFYSTERVFRITSPVGTEFVRYTNEGLKARPVVKRDGTPMTDGAGEAVTREVVFDIAVKAEKNNPFSRLSQNELATTLYKMGAFNPETSSQALIMLSMMDFEGKKEIEEKIRSAAFEGGGSVQGSDGSLSLPYPLNAVKNANRSVREGII